MPATKRSSRSILILTAMILGIIVAALPTALAPEPEPRVTAAASSEAALFPVFVLPTAATTAAPPTTQYQRAITTPTAPPKAPQPVQAPSAPKTPTAPSGGAQDVIRQVFAPYGQAAVDTALRVAWCESKYNPGALSASGTYAGLFQIGKPWADEFASVTGQPYYDGRFDAIANARFAAWLAYEASGGGWGHWSCR